MDFKKLFPRVILIPFLFIIVIGVVLWKSFSKADIPAAENFEPSSQDEPMKEISLKTAVHDQPVEIVPKGESELGTFNEDDAVIQQQFDRDRQEQKQTKYLKTRLEQANLELEQEKAVAEINKLRMENGGAYKDPAIDGQKNFPEVRVEYIGGDSVKKEAILSIGGVNFQVKEKSNPIDNIQVLSISDSGVTLHFSSPQDLTKTIDYKPE